MMSIRFPIRSLCTTAIAALSLGPVAVFAQNATVAGEASVPYPTVAFLSLRWLIRGDANLDAQVTVRFRPQGETAWKTGLPLQRVPADSNVGFAWPNKFAGSLFDLKPDTPYEIQLDLKDPDGGDAAKTLTARTLPVPGIPPGADITDVPAGNYGVLTPPSGTVDKPKVYRSLDGKAVYDFIDLQGKKYVRLFGLTVKSSGANSQNAIKMNNTEGIVIRHCDISGTYGIVAYGEGTKGAYIADNVVTGNNAWTDAAMGANGANEGEGIQITGPGNVIAFNRVRGFRDCISSMEDAEAREQVSMDIYNNDIEVGVDDAVEMDFCFENCRVLRNRIRNSFVGVSSQPSLGGPTYIIRNAMYNVVHGAFKLKRNSNGNVVLHNTVVKVGAGLGGNDAMDFAWFRNNLAFGGPTGGVEWGGYGAGSPYAADIPDPGAHSSFDYDAVGVSGTPYIAKIGGKPFADVEAHGFGNLDLAESLAGVTFPNPPIPERPMADLRPRSTAKVVDAALALPNINDRFLGKGPDIGAYETGQDLPHYGPRAWGSTDENPVEAGSSVLGGAETTAVPASFFVWRNGRWFIRIPEDSRKPEDFHFYDWSGRSFP
jgi:hypothetical protein